MTRGRLLPHCCSADRRTDLTQTVRKMRRTAAGERALANLTHGRAASRREKEGFIVPSRSTHHARKHAMLRRAQLFPTKKRPPFPADPLVDDAACDDAGGGSVTDALFRVQFNNCDIGDKQEGGSGLTEVRDSSAKERGFLLFAATHMPPALSLSLIPSCSLSCVLSFKSRTSHTHSLTHTPSLVNFLMVWRKIQSFRHCWQRKE